MVSYLSILFMAVSLVISVGLPIGLFLFWRKKHGLKIIPVLVGIAAYIIFALILESSLHSLVLHKSVDGKIALLEYSPLLFILYGIFAAGIFEETARFISFFLLRKKYKGIGTGLAYGIGHGGAEAIILVGFVMINTIVMSFLMNSGNAATLGSNPAVADQLNAIATSQPFSFLIPGFERTMAIVSHISLSVLVWCAVNEKGKRWLFPTAILLHALLDTAPALTQAGIITSAFLSEGIILFVTVFISVIAYRVYRNNLKGGNSFNSGYSAGA